MVVNIGYFCKMLMDDMIEVFIVIGYIVLEVWEEFRKVWEKMMDLFCFVGNGFIYQDKFFFFKLIFVLEVVVGEYVLVINGYSLVYVLEVDMELEFLEIVCVCKVVICCWVIFLQKVQVVELVKKYKKVVMFVIGDGVNDVSMIKMVYIGVGISGQEGIQVVLVFDYFFFQFKFLQCFLLVYGCWFYL